MQLSNQILIAGLNNKDKQAFSQLYDLYYTSLCKFVFKYVRSIPIAEDVVQDTFVKLWNSKAPIKSDADIKPYLFQSVRNSAIDYIKEQVKEEALKKNLLQNAQLIDDSLAEKAAEKDMEEKISEIIEMIPENSRNVLKLSRYKGLKYKEIAQELNITIKGVEYHMSRALRCLETELVKYHKAI